MPDDDESTQQVEPQLDPGTAQILAALSEIKSELEQLRRSQETAREASSGSRTRTEAGIVEVALAVSAVAAQQGRGEMPSLPSFRRAFALLSFRSAPDVHSLRKQLGHAGPSALQRYLQQTHGGLRTAHWKHGLAGDGL